MKHVFISYSWQDKPLARRVARRLRHAGLEVFLDQDRAADLGPGRSLPGSLAAAVRDASHVLLVWTPAAAASAAPGRWIGHELELAREAAERGTLLVPLLFHDPKAHPLVNEVVGVRFAPPYRFESAWAELMAAVFPEARGEPNEAVLAADLARVLDETPSIRGVFRNPVSDTVAAVPGAGEAHPPGGAEEERFREAALPLARDAFAAWSPESAATAGLPRLGEAEYHALDFALWCAALRVVRQARRPGLKPVELARYPGIFGRVLAASGAGFDALTILLDAYPGLASDALLELSNAGEVADEVVPVAIDLFDRLFRADVPREWLPFGTAASFVARHGARLSHAQKLRFLDAVEITGNSPHAGPPTDLLLALMAEPRLRGPIVEKVRAWIAGGRFDRVDPERGNEAPYIAHGMVRAMLRLGYAAEADSLLRTAAERIRRLLRSGTDAQRVNALRWITHADRLPMDRRRLVCNAAEEGVYSAEFEGAAYGRAAAPLVMDLCRALQAGERLGDLGPLREALRRAGLPADLV